MAENDLLNLPSLIIVGGELERHAGAPQLLPGVVKFRESKQRHLSLALGCDAALRQSVQFTSHH